MKDYKECGTKNIFEKNGLSKCFAVLNNFGSQSHGFSTRISSVTSKILSFDDSMFLFSKFEFSFDIIHISIIYEHSNLKSK